MNPKRVYGSYAIYLHKNYSSTGYTTPMLRSVCSPRKCHIPYTLIRNYGSIGKTTPRFRSKELSRGEEVHVPPCVPPLPISEVEGNLDCL